MPIFDRENFVGKVTRIEPVEGDFGPQIEGEIERLDDAADRMVWVPIPKRIHRGTTLARWATAVAEVEPEVDMLDFRQKDKALERLCAILQGNYYLWENREYAYSTGSKDRLTPVEKYASEAMAQAAVEGVGLPPPSVEAFTKAEEALRGVLVGQKWDPTLKSAIYSISDITDSSDLMNQLVKVLDDDAARIVFFEQYVTVDNDGVYRSK